MMRPAIDPRNLRRNSKKAGHVHFILNYLTSVALAFGFVGGAFAVIVIADAIAGGR